MKKIIPLLLLAIVMCQCDFKATQDQPEEKSLRDQYPEKFAENYIGERAKTLIDFVPDHAFDASCKPAFTESYFNLLQEAWAVPVYNFGSIGDEEFLYYFLTGNGDCDCPSHPKTILETKVLDDNSAMVKMNYIHVDHEMLLNFVNGEWVIADFDGTKNQMTEYVRNQRDNLMKLDLDSLHNAMLNELVGDFYTKEEVETRFDTFKASLEKYFENYPK